MFGLLKVNYQSSHYHNCMQWAQVTVDTAIWTHYGRTGLAATERHLWILSGGKLSIFSLGETRHVKQCHRRFPPKRNLKGERRNAIMMTLPYSDMGYTFDWLRQGCDVGQPIRSVIQTGILRHQSRTQALWPAVTTYLPYDEKIPIP